MNPDAVNLLRVVLKVMISNIFKIIKDFSKYSVIVFPFVNNY